MQRIELSRGIPRVVNLLCDRALEAAYAQQQRSVDAATIAAAAQALGIPNATQPSATEAAATEAAAAKPAAAVLPVWPELEPIAAAPAGAPSPARKSGAGRYAAIAASVALVGAAVWFGARAMIGGGARDTQPQAARPIPPAPAAQPAPVSPIPPREAQTPPPSAARSSSQRGLRRAARPCSARAPRASTAPAACRERPRGGGGRAGRRRPCVGSGAPRAARGTLPAQDLGWALS